LLPGLTIQGTNKAELKLWHDAGIDAKDFEAAAGISKPGLAWVPRSTPP
jgi:hypothetical protein